MEGDKMKRFIASFWTEDLEGNVKFEGIYKGEYESVAAFFFYTCKEIHGSGAEGLTISNGPITEQEVIE